MDELHLLLEIDWFWYYCANKQSDLDLRIE